MNTAIQTIWSRVGRSNPRPRGFSVVAPVGRCVSMRTASGLNLNWRSLRYRRVSSTMAIRLPLRGMTRVIAAVRRLGASLVSALISLIVL
jgi:hypothetical protein